MTSHAFFESLNKIDRRYLFLLVFLAVLVPMLVMKGGALDEVGKEVHGAYDAVNALQKDDVLLISIDYDATSMPELQPMLEAILEHAFSRGVRIIMMGQLALGLPLGQIALETYAAKHNKVYGQDYVNLGYRPGGVSVIVAMGRELRDLFNTDFQGKPLKDLPMMQNIHNYADMKLLAAFAHGSTVDWWIQYGQSRYGIKVIAGTTAVSAPDAYVYLQSKQLSGLIGGLRGAAEYETLIKSPGVGIRGMPAQTISHFLVILFIIVGNIGFFMTKKRS